MKVATDIGGTFTDLVAIDEFGSLILEKAHTTPPNFDQGVMDVLEKSGLEPQSIDAFFHGTTTIINALTERKGAKTALITTKGFRDILELARGNRPDLFNLVFEKPAPFVPRYLRREVTERISYKGEVITPLCEEDIAKAVDYLKKEQVEAIAVCYINSYANEEHERQTVAKIKELWPEVYVCPSVDITKEWREYERTSTAVLNAYVMPVPPPPTSTGWASGLPDAGIAGNRYIMQSNGGTTTFDQAKLTPINVVESGPVAGVFGASILGSLIGEPNIIAFDVGGTTAKCSLIDQGRGEGHHLLLHRKDRAQRRISHYGPGRGHRGDRQRRRLHRLDRRGRLLEGRPQRAPAPCPAPWPTEKAERTPPPPTPT